MFATIDAPEFPGRPNARDQFDRPVYVSGAYTLDGHGAGRMKWTVTHSDGWSFMAETKRDAAAEAATHAAELETKRVDAERAAVEESSSIGEAVRMVGGEFLAVERCEGCGQRVHYVADWRQWMSSERSWGTAAVNVCPALDRGHVVGRTVEPYRVEAVATIADLNDDTRRRQDAGYWHPGNDRGAARALSDFSELRLIAHADWTALGRLYGSPADMWTPEDGAELTARIRAYWGLDGAHDYAAE